MIRLRFQKPELPPTSAIEPYLELAWRERWFSNDGPCHQLLRRRLAEVVGSNAVCVPVANGTLGLMVALGALTEGRVPERREVVVPSFTYIATVSAIVWAGLEPVFVDVEPGHWHMSVDGLAATLEQRGDRIAAVLPCSTYGTPPPVALTRSWERLAADARVPVVVDSAAGFGALDETGQALGLQGDAEVFSFHATKPFAIGEGGAVITSDQALADRIWQLVSFGLDDDRRLVGMPGLNAKMSELTAATALAVLDRYPAILEARQRIAAEMRARLEPDGYEFQLGSEASTWQFVPTLAPSPERREDIIRASTKRGVQMRVYHEALHQMGPLRRYPRTGDLAVTEDLASRIVTLPMANDLSDEDLELVYRLACSPQRTLARPAAR